MELRLLHAELFLHRTADGFVQRLGVLAEQLVPDRTIVQTRHERRDLRRDVNRLVNDARHQVASTLCTRVKVKTALTKLEELGARTELTLWWFKRLLELGLEMVVAVEAV